MKHRTEKNYKAKVNDHADRLQAMEDYLKFIRTLLLWVGYIAMHGNLLYHFIFAPLLLRTRLFSYSYNPEFGAWQIFVFIGGFFCVLLAKQGDK